LVITVRKLPEALPSPRSTEKALEKYLLRRTVWLVQVVMTVSSILAGSGVFLKQRIARAFARLLPLRGLTFVVLKFRV